MNEMIYNGIRPRMIVKEGALLYQGVGGPMVSPIYYQYRAETEMQYVSYSSITCSNDK